MTQRQRDVAFWVMVDDFGVIYFWRASSARRTKPMPSMVVADVVLSAAQATTG